MLDAFAHEIRFAVTHAASPGKISTVLGQALIRSPEYSRTQLLLVIVDICLEAGRSKQARRWLDTMDSNVAQADLIPALNSALAAGHQQLALDLGLRLVTEQKAEPRERLQIAKGTVMLAKKLHLPYGRNGVWQSHLRLLNLAADLLDDGLISHPDEILHQAARQLVEEIEQIKNCKPRPKPV